MIIQTNEEKETILRQVTDHIYQCINRIKDNIEYIVFIRKNSNIGSISQRFYIQQIDRFSRDAIIAFNHILDKDNKGNTLHALILKIKYKQKRKKFELRLEKLRQDARTIILLRNKVIAHYETSYNSKLDDYYLGQPFGYVYILNPCHCNKVILKTEKLFWDLKTALNINGFGMQLFAGNIKDVFKTKVLGVIEKEKSNLVIFHKCRYKYCLLK